MFGSLGLHILLSGYLVGIKSGLGMWTRRDSGEFNATTIMLRETLVPIYPHMPCIYTKAGKMAVYRAV